jgi:hypothetical protein
MAPGRAAHETLNLNGRARFFCVEIYGEVMMSILSTTQHCPSFGLLE